MKLYRWLFAVPLLLALGGCVPYQQSPTSALDSAVRSGSANAETLEALTELIELKEELKKLRNAVEEIQFNTENAKRRQHNLFQDLDRRLLALERVQRLLSPQSAAANNGGIGAGSGALDSGAPREVTPGAIPGVADGATGSDAAGAAADAAIVAGGDAAAPTITTAPSDPAASLPGAVSVQEQQIYDQAFDLLKQTRYQDAIDQFQRLADRWPDGQLADDAYYWMSEAQYVNREYEAALDGFRSVVTRYRDSQRVPEALLKIGYIRYDIGEYQEAAEIFRDILARFPGHQVAVSAQTRLRRLEHTIQ